MDSPERKLAAVLDGDVVVVIQEQPLGTADAVRAATGEIGDGDTVVVLNGDTALVSPETVAGLVADA